MSTGAGATSSASSPSPANAPLGIPDGHDNFNFAERGSAECNIDYPSNFRRSAAIEGGAASAVQLGKVRKTTAAGGSSRAQEQDRAEQKYSQLISDIEHESDGRPRERAPDSDLEAGLRDGSHVSSGESEHLDEQEEEEQEQERAGLIVLSDTNSVEESEGLNEISWRHGGSTPRSVAKRAFHPVQAESPAGPKPEANDTMLVC